MRYKVQRTICIAGCALTAVAAHAGYSFTSFNASQWGASDATLGVSGYVIEDFEDLNIVSGLQVGVSSVNGSYGPTSTLPNTFNPFTDSTAGTAFQLDGGGQWDGTHGMINTRTNREFPYTESNSWGSINLTLGGFADSFGFSFQQMDQLDNLFINGQLQGNLASLAGWATNGLRQGYLRIDGTSGSSISNIQIQNVNGDGFMIDHVAFHAVPEPASLVVFGFGGLALAALRRRC